MEINLNNPIFAYYIDISDITPSFQDNYLSTIQARLNRYSNVSWILVPTNFTKIECIWTSNFKTSFINRLNNFLKQLDIDPNELPKLKQDLRELLINLINEEENF
jgi:hypothetical protein